MNRSALLLSPAGRLARVVSLALGLALAGLVTSVGTAGAASAPLLSDSNCTQAGITFTCTFSAAGETRLTGVPVGVTSITATVVGAQGGPDPYSGAPGGLGAQATGSFSVTPGQILYLEVGVLGGAGGAVTGVSGGAGGGESDVRTCSATGSCSSGSALSSRLLVAGGGGGAGTYSGPGGNAGTTGAAGDGGPATGGTCHAGVGTGATRSVPGTGGAACGGGSDGTHGASGAGGAGANAQGTSRGNAGGGGGAGWYGGGGGGAAGADNQPGGAGGGGSSNAASSVTGETFTQAAAGQAPSVTLTFTQPCAQSGPPFTCTYTTAGESSFTVPSGVSSVSVTAVGAGGSYWDGHGALARHATP